MARRQYSDEDKATALAALDANGGNVKATAKQVGVSTSTLRGWRDGRGTNAGVADLRPLKKGDLAEHLHDLAWQLAEAIPDKIKGATLAQVATAFGIVVDKRRVLIESQGGGFDSDDGGDIDVTSEEIEMEAALDD